MTRQRRRRLLSANAADDLLPGEFVKMIGLRGTGLVVSVSNGHATVAWNAGTHDILPFSTLVRVQEPASLYDTRRPR